jgi:FlaA1/EpsC-like NDP-sugar epimerase
MGNVATQYFNLREQMKAEIASHERRMLRASHGQYNRIVDYNNQLVVYITRLLGVMSVRMLAFLWFDYYGKTITGRPRIAWLGAGRAGKALSRRDRNHPKDGIF